MVLRPWVWTCTSSKWATGFECLAKRIHLGAFLHLATFACSLLQRKRSSELPMSPHSPQATPEDLFLITALDADQSHCEALEENVVCQPIL